MSERDVPRSPDWQDTGDTVEATHDAWGPRISDEGITGPELGVVRLPVKTTFGEMEIPGPTGQPRGLRHQITHTISPTQQHWLRKQQEEPCFRCVHFIDRFTPEQKAGFIEALAKEHGWTTELITLDIGNISNYRYCRVYELLTHKMASCPRYFRPKD